LTPPGRRTKPLRNDTSSSTDPTGKPTPTPARCAPRPQTDPPLAAITALEPQGEGRRRQLVEIAARVIEQEGVDAVHIPRVAELAGVGRTALYRYFPRREDLLAAVYADFDERLRERVGPEKFAEALRALGSGNPDEVPPSTARLFTAIWDVPDECGPAGLILRAHATAHDGDEREQPGAGERFQAQWIEVGLSSLEATLVADTANAILTRLSFSTRRGRIGRGQALRLGSRALVGLARGVTNARTT
jgi:AcrR family transcriptional regulator